MYQLQRQDFMNRGGVVPVPFEVPAHDAFETAPLKIRPGERAGVQQHFLYILGKSIAVPDPEMVELVAAEEEPFRMERRKQVIDSRHPLGHAMVIGILRLERELEQAAGDFSPQASGIPAVPTIGPDL